MSKTYLKGSLLATTVIAGFAVAVPAYAQDAPPPAPEGTTAPAGETPISSSQAGSTAEEGPGVQAAEAVPPAPSEGGEIIVTGSLIRNPNLTSSSPVAVVGQEEIQLRQTTLIEEVLRSVPGVVPNLGQNVNNGAAGFSNVDLRGLGAKRNLVMLDSTRITPATSVGTVDLNNIPLSLIDRVDVLTGGASTVYGADAVTGVVNFITKKNFAGIDLQVSENITERGDGNVFRADLALGANFDDGRGNAVMAIGYIESDPVYFGDRPLGECVISSFTAVCGGDSPTATPSSFAFPGDPSQNYQVPPPGGGAELLPQYAVFNFNPFNVYQTPFKRYNAYAQAHYDISDHVTVYGRALYSRNYTSSIIAPSGVFGEALTIPGWSPFLTPEIRNQICAINALDTNPVTMDPCEADSALDPAISLGYVYRRTVEVGPRIDQQNTNVFDFKAGVTWNITQNISFDLYGAYGESDVTQRRLNYVAKSRLQQALDVSQADPTVCANNAGGCVPLNLFGPPGSITPEMAGFIGGVVSSIQRGSTLAQVHGVVSGDFGVNLPWASDPISFAVGAEHRDYTGFTRPDALALQPGELGGAGGAILPIEGGYTAEDAFAELILPIASDRPWAQELTLEAGYRYSKYEVDTAGNPSFNASSYKIGGTWQPVEEFKIRGNWQQAVRAPNIVELFFPLTVGLTNLASDPCAGTLNPANVSATVPLNPNLADPNLVATCLAQGAPAGAIGAIQQPAAGQANASFSGNPTLQPETAHTWTIGIVVTPRNLIPGFNMTLDYYSIKVEDAITFPTPGDNISACFGGADASNLPAGAATSPACLAIRRNPANGRLSGSPATTFGLPAGLTNAGRLKTDGVDLTANYRRNIGFADLILNFAGNWTNTAKFWASDSSENPPNCPGVYSVNCGISIGQLQPEWSWNQRTTLSFKPVDVSLLWRHLSKFEYQSDLPPLCDDDPGTASPNPACDGTIQGGPLDGKSINFNKIPAYNYFDLTTRFSITDHFDLTLSAFNLFDKKAPIVGANGGSTSANSGNTFPSTYDMMGRRYAATVRLKF